MCFNNLYLKIIAEFKLTNPVKNPQISGTALKNDIYAFEQLHFHWSGSNDKGSEHTINDEHFSMEVNKKFSSVH